MAAPAVVAVARSYVNPHSRQESTATNYDRPRTHDDRVHLPRATVTRFRPRPVVVDDAGRYPDVQRLFVRHAVLIDARRTLAAS